ncbi:MAG: gamma-butyrobetaine dioxygenase [Arenicella sp.]|jgi:gamma-butyrobetaine dioxygenase
MKHYLAATPDNLAWPTAASIEYSELVDDGAIVVHWADQQHSRFHPLWLRDNCACDVCLHSFTREHLSDLLDLPLDISADQVSVDSDGALVVSWLLDRHVSVFNPGWLFAHSGLSPQQSSEPLLWTASERSEPISFNVRDEQLSDDLLLEVLLAVESTGLARIRNFGSSRDTVEALGLRIGPVRETHFARIFDVVSRADGDSNAYTSERLSAHTDIPTRESPPGLQVLHCLVADAQGGASTMTDGFKVAADLADQFPQDFAILSSVKWCFANRAGDTDYRWQAPIINIDDEGRVFEVRLLPFSRAPLITEYHNIEPAYRALQRFMQMANSATYQMSYKFAAGDIVIFDNRRILHGREEFFPQSGDRELRGLYLDRDDMHSKIRMHINRRNRQD